MPQTQLGAFSCIRKPFISVWRTCDVISLCKNRLQPRHVKFPAPIITLCHDYHAPENYFSQILKRPDRPIVPAI
jgi:hypothetical protein